MEDRQNTGLYAVPNRYTTSFDCFEDKSATFTDKSQYAIKTLCDVFEDKIEDSLEKTTDALQHFFNDSQNFFTTRCKTIVPNGY